MVTRLVLVAAASAALFLSPGFARLGALPAEATIQNPAPQGAASQIQPNQAEMKKIHEKMMSEMKASDAKLDALVKDMNTAAGDAKIKAMADVLNELVRQNKSMHAHMDTMHQSMMGGHGMMGH